MQSVQKITACAFIHHDGMLFAARRAQSKQFFPGKFELPGGHVEFGEDIVTGLKREIAEELHMQIRVGDAYYAFTYTYLSKTIHAVEIVYFAQFITPLEQLTLNKKDHSEYRFITKDEAQMLWTPKDTEWNAVKRGFELLGNSSKLLFGKE